MKIITISREFGSGGRELGKRLADALNFDYYDKEIISAIAANSGLHADYVENVLSSHGWKEYSLNYRKTLNSSAAMQANKINLLLEQKHVIEQIAALGKDCIIVGRNADVILEAYHPFNIFVCAKVGAKVKRCMERTPEGETLTEKALIRQMKQIDKVRSQTREILTGSSWGNRDAYHLTVNTTDWNIKELAPALAAFAGSWFH